MEDPITPLPPWIYFSLENSIWQFCTAKTASISWIGHEGEYAKTAVTCNLIGSKIISNIKCSDTRNSLRTVAFVKVTVNQQIFACYYIWRIWRIACFRQYLSPPTYTSIVHCIDGPRGDAKFNSRQITLFWETSNFIAAKICWFTVTRLDNKIIF